MAKFNNNILELKERVEKELRNFFKSDVPNKHILPKNMLKLIDCAEEFTLRGGKRIRSILMLLIYKAYKSNITDDIYRASIIWELLQSFLLIHDDIIDQDDIRRGGPTVHKKIEHDLNSSHLGISHAILIGDLLSLWSNIILTEIDSENKIECINFLNKEIANVVYGEMIDIFSWNSLKNKDLENRINLIHEMKTVAYTTKGPMIAGAILSGAPKEDIDLLSKISLNLGLAFQIKDDLLGIFGDSKKTGKSSTSDLNEGKLTYLISYTLNNGSNEDISVLKNTLGKNNVDKKMIDAVKNIFINNGAKRYCDDKIENYTKEAISNIKKLNIEDTNKILLSNLFKGLLERDN